MIAIFSIPLLTLSDAMLNGTVRFRAVITM